jgi:hypothetical protein
MKQAPDPALDLAHRLAAGEAIDPAALADADPRLARGLARMAAIRGALAPDLPAGATWGHLQRLEPAGQGSFGEVFRAFDPTLDRWVALKLKRRDAPDTIFSGRDFVAEARRLARVRHPNVLAVHGASYHDDRAGLWSDWIDGETLRARLDREGRLSADALLQLATELAAALAAVHAAGLVHGDVSAANVMIDARGHAVLMDFGAGFASDSEGQRLGAGTPRYLAPEAVRGEPVTSAVDVYALGVLLHRAATGAHHDDPSSDALRATPEWRGLIAALREPEAARRPAATEVVQRLDALRTAPLHRARRRARQALAAGLAAVAVAAGIGYWRAEAARERTAAALQRAEVSNTFMSELLGLASADALGQQATLRDLLDAAPGLIERHTELAAMDRAHLLSVLSALEGDLANDEAAARLGTAAAALAAQTAPDSDLALHLAAEALRWRAVAGQADAAVAEGTALLERVSRAQRDPALRAFIEYCLAEAEFRQSVVRSSPELLQRIRDRLARVLDDPARLDGLTESAALRRLANLRMESGDFVGAQQVAERAVARSALRLGDAHPVTALARRILGWTLIGNSDIDGALAQFETNLRLHETKVGPRSRTVVDDRIGRGFALLAGGRAGEALPLSRGAWEDANALYGPDNRSTIDAGLGYVGVLMALHDHAAAHAVLVDLRARLQARDSRASRQYLHVSRELAKVEEALGLASQAAATRADCRAAGLVAYGPAHSLTTRCDERLDAQAAAPAAVPR